MEIYASYSVFTTNVQEIAFSILFENYFERSVLSSLVSENTIIDFCRNSNRLLYSLWYVNQTKIFVVSLQCITSYISPQGYN